MSCSFVEKDIWPNCSNAPAKISQSICGHVLCPILQMVCYKASFPKYKHVQFSRTQNKNKFIAITKNKSTLIVEFSDKTT